VNAAHFYRSERMKGDGETPHPRQSGYVKSAYLGGHIQGERQNRKGVTSVVAPLVIWKG